MSAASKNITLPVSTEDTVLIVDDNPRSLGVIVSYLEESGINTLIASDGEIALERAKYTHPDIILLDVLMPGIDGFETCRMLKSDEETKGIPVIFMTALTDTEHKIKGFSVGAVDYITKPVQQEELLARVTTHLENRKYRVRLEEEVRKRTIQLEKRTLELEMANQQLNLEIIERKRTEEILQFKNTLLSTQQETSLDGILVVDEAGEMISFNQRFADMWGIPDDVMASRSDERAQQSVLDKLVAPEEFLARVNYLYEHPVEKSHEEIALVGGITFERYSSPMFSADGKYYGRVWYFRDITEHKKAEEEKARLEIQLRQAHKMEAIGTLAGGIAHEFNNLLGIIVGNTELAMDGVPEWNTARYNLEEIRTACLRARDVVRQILAFSRHTEHALKPVMLNSVVEESLRLLRSSIPTSIEVRQNISKELGVVLADSTQINQVLINFCTNAAHAMRNEGGILDVSLDNVELGEGDVTHYPELSPGNYVKLTVSDTGHGMEPGIMDRVFDPYFTTKQVGEGTGMGLAVAHGIVKKHGGHITVESKSDKGSTFQVFLPRVEKEVKPEIVPTESLPKGSERILFVDDEISLVKLNKLQLEQLGYRVETKTSPVEALELFRTDSEGFDLVITDMTMPHMTGDRLTNELLKIQPDIPVILCTGHSDKMNKEKAKESGIRFLVMKPATTRDMAETIRKVLNQS